MAAQVAINRKLENEKQKELEYQNMTEVQRLRYDRKIRREMEKSGSALDLYKIKKKINLDPKLHHPILKPYIYFAGACNSIAQSGWFSNLILLCIIGAGILVGLQTYPELQNDDVLQTIDFCILISFTTEVVLKIIGEGAAPWLYFFGPEWAWNIFDFAIVTFSMPFIPFKGGQLKLLRLIRLMRLAKAFRKIPQLQMIVQGLIGGLKSIVYIVVLMLLVFYLYACAGIIFFKGNDPFHFKSVEVSMLTLLGVATLDGWGDILFINYFGCDVYSGGFYTTIKDQANTNTGGISWCGTPNAQPVVSAIYFISFIVLAAFCILSLFIGAVAMSMVDSMQEMKATKGDTKEKKIQSARAKILADAENKTTLDRKQMRSLRLIELAFQGEDLRQIEKDIDLGFTGVRLWFKNLAYMCGDLCENVVFSNFMTIVIVLAGVNVGIGTDPKMSEKLAAELHILDICILYIFLSEIVIKMLSFEMKPYKYFYDSWNCFDFVVVAGSFLLSGGSLITILRLLRLLRVLKLLRALPQLTMIISALMKGMSAIIFIFILLFIFYYFFGIIGVLFLGANDVWHFASLHMALLTLFQASTMDNWSSTMWISLYGCDVQNGNHPELCTQPQGQFILAAFFFMLIVLVGGLVLITLFIGVVGMSMDEASREQKKEKEIEDRALLVGSVENLDEDTVRLFKEVFNSLDLIRSTRIGAEEMKFGLKLAGLNLNEEEFRDVWSKVDRDKSNGIDFAEFLEFMCDLRSNLRRLTSEEAGENFATPQGVQRRAFTFTSPKRTHDANADNDANKEDPQHHTKPGYVPGPEFDDMDETALFKEFAKPIPLSPKMQAMPMQPLTPIVTQKPAAINSDKEKAFSVGRELNQVAKRAEPGRGGDAATNNSMYPKQDDSLVTPKRELPKEGLKKYSSPPLEKSTISSNGDIHNFSVVRAQSSFQKVPFGGTLEIEADGPESPIRIRNSPSGRSPYAPGTAIKKPVKSLVVSI